MTVEDLRTQIELAENNFKHSGINTDLQAKIEKVYDLFDTSFIHREEELVLHKKWNIYFRLPDIFSRDDFDYKLLSYLSFYTASNHSKRTSVQCKYVWNRLNRWFRREFTYEELQVIYQKLGCGANRTLGNDFIVSGLDMKLLEE